MKKKTTISDQVQGELWWKKNDTGALVDVKEGRYTEIKTHEELDKFLDSL